MVHPCIYCGKDYSPGHTCLKEPKRERTLIMEAPKKYGITGISKAAWDACCDGEWLKHNYDLDYDPWMIEDDSKAREIEADAQRVADELE